ncbi:MAG: replicative DNA helicase [Prevotella sp.]|nr:replicative DNA helicase [Prevotella sp.]
MNPDNGLTPSILQSEQAVLGACLVSQEALYTALGALTVEDFFNFSNKLIFSAIRDMFSSGRPVNPATVSTELKRKKQLDRVGGQAYLDELIDCATSPDTVEFEAEVLLDLSQRRRLLEAGRKIANLAYDPTVTNDAILSQASQLLFKASENKVEEEFTPLTATVNSALADATKRFEGITPHTGYTTGLKDIDYLTGGLTPGSLTILAARPAMGKTALALNFAQFGGTGNKPAVIFSLEMPAQQLALRMMSAQSGVPLSGIINGTLSTGQFKAVKQASEEVAARQIYISDNSSLSTADFMIKARRFKTKHPDTALIIVDYLQLMTAGRKYDSRVLEVSEISRTLKAVARELNVPVLALSQLSRAPESRPDKKPQLSDLRDSGAIEQDADLVMMLYREDYYGDNENSDLVDSKADLRVAKNRNGATGVVHLTFKREITRFVNFGEE